MDKTNRKILGCKNMFFFILLLLVLVGNIDSALATEATSTTYVNVNGFQISSESYEAMKNEIQDWVKTSKGKILLVESQDANGKNKNIYMAQMPNPKDGGKIRYLQNAGTFAYETQNSNGVTVYVPFDVDVAVSDNKNSLNQMNGSNYQNYAVEDPYDAVLQREDGKLIKKVNFIEAPNGKSVALYVQLPDGTFIKSDSKNVDVDKSVWDVIVNGVESIADYVLDILTDVINKLLLKIADGIQGLINYIMDADVTVTVHDVIFGKIDKLSINFWGSYSASDDSEEDGTPTEGDGNSIFQIDTPPVAVLKNIVSYWYGVLRGIAVTIYLVMLLYIGVRILLASTGGSAQRYKEMISSWLAGVFILFCFPMVMRYTVIINDAFVGMLDSNVVNIETNDANKPDDAMIAVRQRAESEENLALTIVYIIMLGQLIVLLGVYYKRVFMIAFLITIFPVVAVLYIWNKSNGGGKAFSNWTKEFVVSVFAQTFHAVVYVILVEGTYSAFVRTNGEQWFMFVLSVMFLFEGEKIIRSIFGMKSSAGTIRDLAATGATVWATSTAVKKIFKGDKHNKTQDQQDLEETDRIVEGANRRTAVNNMLRNTLRTAEDIEGDLTEGARSSLELNNIMTPEDLEAAQAVVDQEALKAKTKKGGVFAKAVSATARATGITLGVTSGLASGSVQQGIGNAVMFNEITGMAANGINGVTGWAKGAFAGKVMKVKIRSGAMDDKLREAGFDFDAEFDPDPIISERKAEIIREALAEQIEGTRSGGRTKGQLRFIDSVEKQLRRDRRR